MKRIFQRQRVIRCLVAFGILVLVAQLLIAWRASAARTVVIEEIRQAAAEWAVLAESRIAPTASNLEAIRAERARCEAQLSALVQAMVGPGKTVASTPALNPKAVYFEVVELIERMRLVAESAGVVTKPEETFGFQRFIDAHQILLPADADAAATSRVMERIHLQHQMAEALLGCLFSAAPHALESVEREPVTDIPEVSGSLPSGLFRREPSMLQPTPEGLESSAFRFVFVGRTAALRAFLRGVADLELPVTVSAVTVARELSSHKPSLALLGGALSGDEDGPPPDADGAVKIIEATESRFTVVVEWHTIAAPVGEVAAE